MSSATYDYSANGAYTGTAQTYLIDNSSILGEWIQIQFPYAIFVE